MHEPTTEHINKKRFRVLDAIELNVRAAWALAFVLPLIVVVIIQIPLYEIRWFSHLFDRLDFWIGLALMSVLFMSPSFICLALIKQPRQSRLAAMGLFILCLVVYLPLLFFYGFYTACLFFGRCL